MVIDFKVPFHALVKENYTTKHGKKSTIRPYFTNHKAVNNINAFRVDIAAKSC